MYGTTDGLNSQPTTACNRKISNLRRALPQALASSAFGLLLFSVACINTMSIVVTQGLLSTTEENTTTLENESTFSNTEDFTITREEASLVASLVFLAQPIGSIASGFLQETFGRKNCMIAVTVPQLFGWLLILFSTSINHLYIASVIMGLSIGFMEAPSLSFLSEVCEAKYRGSLALFVEIFPTMGVIFEFILTVILPWRTACMVSAFIPVLVCLCLLVVPESPTWLVMTGKVKEAEINLQWLRGWVTPEEVAEERKSIVETVQKSPMIHMGKDTSAVIRHQRTLRKPFRIRFRRTLLLLTEQRILRPLLLVSVCALATSCLCLLGPRQFLPQIFAKMGLPITADQLLLLSGFMQVVGGITSAFLIRSLGRRPFGLLALPLSIISCFAVGLHSLLNINSPGVPLFFISLIFFLAGFATSPLPWVLLCEVFPLDAKGIGGGVSAAIIYVSYFFVTKTYIYLEDYLNFGGAVIIYGIIGLLGTVYLFFEMPETEGKTIEEIELYFNKEKRQSSEPLKQCH